MTYLRRFQLSEETNGSETEAKDGGPLASEKGSTQYDEYYEVCITDIDDKEWFYWVKCDDDDDAVEAAQEWHEELDRPDIKEDFDEGVFPMAYQPVIEWNKEAAVIIDEI